MRRPRFAIPNDPAAPVLFEALHDRLHSRLDRVLRNLLEVLEEPLPRSLGFKPLLGPLALPASPMVQDFIDNDTGILDSIPVGSNHLIVSNFFGHLRLAPKRTMHRKGRIARHTQSFLMIEFDDR